MKKPCRPPVVRSLTSMSAAEQEHWKKVIRSARDEPMVILPPQGEGWLVRLWRWLLG